MKKLLLSALLLVVFPALAQPNAYPQLDYRGKTYQQYILKAFRYPSSLGETCSTHNAFALVRFRIDQKGGFAQLNVEGSVSDSIKTYLKDEFRRTSGHWKSSRIPGKTVHNPVYVQPILFKLHDGCNYLTEFEQALMLLTNAAGRDEKVLSLLVVVGFPKHHSDTER